MTKNEKEELIWRLKERPSAEGVARLVEMNIINNKEARDLLFSKPEEKNTNEEIKALKEQVQFLQGLVESLISQRSTTLNPHHYTVRTPFVYWKNFESRSNKGLQYEYDPDSRQLTMSVIK